MRVCGRQRQRSRTVAVLLFCVELAAVAIAAEPAAVLRVGTSGDYPPFSRAGEGFDVEVARLLASELGLRLVWVSFRWPELARDVEAGAFDVAMSGVTWRPERAARGWMSRAVAVGGPCVVGAAAPRRIAVNRGGILERWTLARFEERQIETVERNLTLPELLRRGEVDAFVTDSFEVGHFRRPGQPVRCQPATDRKVYWVAPHRADDLGPQIDAWLGRSEPQLDALRRRHFGASAPRDGVDHLIDLLARRLAYMPLVAAWKRRHGVPIEDRAREARVLEAAVDQARAAGLAPEPVRRLFAVSIELAKAIQRREGEGSASLELESEIRPALLRLGERTVEALAAAGTLEPEALGPSRLALLPLEPEERDLLRRALLGVWRPD